MNRALPRVKPTLLLAALALIVVTNAIVLAGVASNRRGAPDATLTLTERELPIGWVEKEDSGLSLRLDWNGLPWNRETDWFDQAKLQSLGFDCRVPPDDHKAELFYEKALPLERYAVLEFEGDAYKAWLALEQKEIEEMRRKVALRQETEKALHASEASFAEERVRRSRLDLVDVGRDAAELRRRYADRSRFIVAAATVRLSLMARRKTEDGKEHPASLRGDVSEILISAIHVPLGWRPLFDALRAEEERASRTKTPVEYGRPAPDRARPPRYEVTVQYGRRLEPWIAKVRRLS